MQDNPGRTWAKKHKDAWSNHVHLHKPALVQADVNFGKRRKICRFFNKNGKCTKGAQCEFDHRCSVCFMFGHGKYNCRKAAKRESKETSSQNAAGSAHTSNSTASV